MKDSWLVSGLYDWYCQRESARVLEILLDLGHVSLSDPCHDKHLLDKIGEGLRQGGKHR